MNVIGGIIFAGIEVAVVFSAGRATVKEESIADYSELVAWVVIAFSLIISVYLMNRTIKQTEFALPNQRLVIAHQLNFVIWLIVYSFRKVLFLRSDRAYLKYLSTPEDEAGYNNVKEHSEICESEYYIGIVVETAFSNYLNIFFLYLIVRLLRHKKTNSHDPILNREVPQIVVLQN